jgi:prepilin peptidase CpaA
MTAVFVFAPFIVLLVMAAGWDLATYTIPNFVSGLLLAAFIVFAIVSGMSGHTLAMHALSAFLALLVGFALFSLGYIGGGDAKLFAAAASWFGLHDLLQYTLIASVFGGALTLLLLTIRAWPLPLFLANRGWIARLHEPKGGIPYGVALAAGALAVLPYTDIFHRTLG